MPNDDAARVGRVVGPIRLPTTFVAAGALFHTNKVLLWGESLPTRYRALRAILGFFRILQDPLIQQELNWVVVDFSRNFGVSGPEDLVTLQLRVGRRGAYGGEPDGRANLWCGGSAFLPDGRLLLVAGDDDTRNDPSNMNLKVVRVVDVMDTTPGFTPAADMHLARWYPGVVILPNGRALVSFGVAPALEVFEPLTGAWTRRASTVHIDPKGLYDDYPWTFVMADGRVLLLGSWGPRAYLYDELTNTIATAGKFHEHVHRHGGSAILLAPSEAGKVLVVGGGGHYGGLLNIYIQTRSVHLYDAQQDRWTSRHPIRKRRGHFGLVLLPTGQVWVSGGGGGRFHIFPERRSTEIYDPDRDMWTATANLRKRRGYHHVTLLLPDGSVLVAGEEATAEVYYPPYFFRGPRSAIRTAPSSIVHGTGFHVDFEEVPEDPVARVVLVRQGAMTHSFTADQRVVVLAFNRVRHGVLTVDAPATANLAPPGYYLIFLVSRAGLPSQLGVWTRLA